MIYLTDDYGIKMKDGIFSGFSTVGGEITGISPTTLGKPSYVDDITNATSDDPDALVMIAYPKTGSTIVTESLLTSVITQGGILHRRYEWMISSPMCRKAAWQGRWALLQD